MFLFVNRGLAQASFSRNPTLSVLLGPRNPQQGRLWGPSSKQGPFQVDDSSLNTSRHPVRSAPQALWSLAVPTGAAAGERWKGGTLVGLS